MHAHTFAAPLASIPDTKHKLKFVDLDEYSTLEMSRRTKRMGHGMEALAHKRVGARAACAFHSVCPSCRAPAFRAADDGSVF